MSTFLYIIGGIYLVSICITIYAYATAVEIDPNIEW